MVKMIMITLVRVYLLSDDGSTVAIGASRNDGNGDRAGHVRIYRAQELSV